MENSLKALILAAGVVITCIVISLGFYISREARDTSSKGVAQITKLNAEFDESDKVMYDGLPVRGSEVINVVNKFKNEELSIVVNTKKSSNQYGRAITIGSNNVSELGSRVSNSIKTAQNIDSANYINQNAQFVGEILRDANNTIVGIRFVQS